MFISNFPYRHCLITDPAYLPEDEFEEKILEALDGGVDMVQYRNHSGAKEIRLRQAKILRRITRERSAALIINGDVELAVTVQADGVQLGKRSASLLEAKRLTGKKLLIGASVHNTSEIRKAETSGVDFLLLSPLFSPGSKTTNSPILGSEKFAVLCQATPLPVFALGGITPVNARTAIQCGAHGLAVVSGILAASSIREAAKRMRKAFL